MGLGIIAAVFLLITIVLLIAWAIARHYDGIELQIDSFLTTSLIACGCITFIFGVITLIATTVEADQKIRKERAEEYAKEIFDEGAADAEVGLPYSNRHSGEQRKQYRDGYLSKKK